MKRTIIAAALFAATPALANPLGYDSSWTSKEAADSAMAADHAYNHCMFHICGTTAARPRIPLETS